MSETEDDEQILLVVHKHWGVLVGESAPLFLLGFLVLTFLFIFRGLPSSIVDASMHTLVTLLVPLSLLILWTIFTLLWTNYYLDMLVLTDRRLFYTSQINFTQREIEQWNIADIRSVSARFTNLFQSFFNYGSLLISTRSSHVPMTVNGIPDPEYVGAVILKQDDRYGQLKETSRKQRELLGFLSHEVKGHLAKSKAAFAAIVEGDFGAVSAPLQSMAGQALADSQRGVETVMNILDNSDTAGGEMRIEKKQFDLSSLVRGAVEEFRTRASEKHLLVNVAIDDACTIAGDEQKIARHVIRNLIDNAIRYTPAGHIDVSLKNEGEVVIFSVADSGVGIVTSDMTKLFTEGGMGEGSKKINPDSTGYGLFVAKKIVDAHGGRIWARSAGPGTGSTFSAEFPLAV